MISEDTITLLRTRYQTPEFLLFLTYHSYYDINNTIMSQTITTNLRIDKDEWSQLKVMAAELNMSVNQYVKYLLRHLSAKRILHAHFPDRSKLPIWRLGEIGEKMKIEPGKLSEEDKIIYE